MDLCPPFGVAIMSLSEVHAAVRRALAARLYDDMRRMPIREALQEYLIHGVKYACPPDRGGPTRGIPTSYAAPPLNHLPCILGLPGAPGTPSDVQGRDQTSEARVGGNRHHREAGHSLGANAAQLDHGLQFPGIHGNAHRVGASELSFQNRALHRNALRSYLDILPHEEPVHGQTAGADGALLLCLLQLHSVHPLHESDQLNDQRPHRMRSPAVAGVHRQHPGYGNGALHHGHAGFLSFGGGHPLALRAGVDVSGQPGPGARPL